MNKDQSKEKVQSTALTSILMTAIGFLVVAYLIKDFLAALLEFDAQFIEYGIWILFLDALCIIPFAWMRNKEMPLRYSYIKITNVAVNLGLNLFFFLALTQVLASSAFFDGWDWIVFGNKVHYIFMANAIASLVTFLTVLPLYFKIGIRFDVVIWKKMIRYAFPVLLAGVAYTVNEGFDKILLKYLLRSEERRVGKVCSTL